MTGGAGHGHVGTGQREFRGVVIKGGSSPARGGVAKRAIRRKSSGNVGRVVGPVEVRLVAGNAGRRRVVVVVAGVALCAGHGGVLAGERVMRVERVIEFCIRPIGRRMAGRAVARQAELHVRRIVGGIEIRIVARVARRRSILEDVIQVAGGTGEGSMHAGQRIAGVFQVVKFGVEPAVHGVATLAGGGEAERCVIEDGGAEVLLMAGVAAG